jgi:hypothetical protein
VRMRFVVLISLLLSYVTFVAILGSELETVVSGRGEFPRHRL